MSRKNNVRSGIRHPQSFPPVYYMPRPPTTSDQMDRWTNRRYEISSFWIIGKNPVNGIPVASGTEGDLYYLCKYESNGDATWCKFDIVPGGSGLDAIRDQVDAVVDVDASGYSDIDGVVVANNAITTPFETVKSTSTLNLQMKLSAAITGAPGDSNDAGISSYNDTQFVVDSDGYVSFVGGTDLPSIQTLSDDSDTARGPDANGNVEISGGPGVTITGDTNEIIVNSVIYTDQAGSTSVTSDSGSFATDAVTLTLPASPAQGERVELIATNGVLTVQAAGTQVIHLGGDSSSAGGTCTGSASGDALSLIYQSSTDDWWALSAVGVWILA